MNSKTKSPTSLPRVAAYLRVSTEEQADSGLGLAAQQAAIEDECARRGWDLVAIHVDEGLSGSVAPEKRPALANALAQIKNGQADTLLVHRLDRLTRSVLDLCRLLDAAQKGSWALTAADGTIDTTTPHGRAMAQMTGVFAELERALIADRTKAALAAKKAAGARLGRPILLANEVRYRIAEDKAAGLTLQAIADRLTGEGIKTATGKARWYPSTVKSVLDGLTLDAEAERVNA
jgi:DNA invertase Pin-like site-specific DNA recombinase